MLKSLFIQVTGPEDEAAAVDIMARILGPSWVIDAGRLGPGEFAAAGLLLAGGRLDEAGSARVLSALTRFPEIGSRKPYVLFAFADEAGGGDRSRAEEAMAVIEAALGRAATRKFVIAKDRDAYLGSAIEAGLLLRGVRDGLGTSQLGEKKLRARIEAFLAAHSTCALATSFPDGSPRVTPIEYLWMDGAFWFFSEGGVKFANLARCDRVSLCVYDEYRSMGEAKGLQVSGRADLVPEGSEDWTRLFAARGIDPTVLARQCHRLNLFRVRPDGFELLDATLRAEGADPRQLLRPDGPDGRFSDIG